jgi:hypothetical protein
MKTPGVPPHPFLCKCSFYKGSSRYLCVRTLRAGRLQNQPATYPATHVSTTCEASPTTDSIRRHMTNKTAPVRVLEPMKTEGNCHCIRKDDDVRFGRSTSVNRVILPCSVRILLWARPANASAVRIPILLRASTANRAGKERKDIRASPQLAEIEDMRRAHLAWPIPGLQTSAKASPHTLSRNTKAGHLAPIR